MNWTSTYSFLVDRTSGLRLIDSAKRSFNGTHSASETIHTTSRTAGVNLAKDFRRIAGMPLRGRRQLRAGATDMRKAYKYILRDDKYQQILHGCVFDPNSH